MTAGTSRRFSDLRKDNPKISDSKLLNSNNRSSFTGDADVVVAGAGILGLCYAIHLKTISPHLNIEIFEKSPAPMQKIGESTLSPFAKFTTEHILPQEYLLRLFALKNGLQFYCLDKEGKSVTSTDLGGHDISYQLDRRMSELFLTMWAQAIGINVYHGVEIDFEIPKGGAVHSFNPYDEVMPESDMENGKSLAPFETPRVILKDSSQTTGTHVNAKMVCDASGFSRRLTSKFGPREKLEGAWNCDAYWAYFREKENKDFDGRLDHWDFPATNHICFPEGWGWFIGLISWHHVPLGNLMDMVSYIIDNARAGVPADDLPGTKALSEMFDCPYEFITSIGWAVRNDYKYPEDMSKYGASDSEQKFHYFKRKYPTLNHLMDGSYDLLPKYYGERTYFARKAMASRSPIVAGEGWLAIGNSSGFTNPLISPGINVGMSGAWTAANLTHEILAAPMENARAMMQKSANKHQTHIHDYVMPRLNYMNRLWYNSFRDHRLFEAITKCIWATSFGKIPTTTPQGPYTLKDSRWVTGTGMNAYLQYAKDVLEILEPSDGGAPPSEEQVEKVLSLSNRTVQRCNELYPDNKWGAILRHYDDNLQRTGKDDRQGNWVWVTRCSKCNYWVDNSAKICPICESTEIWA